KKRKLASGVLPRGNLRKRPKAGPRRRSQSNKLDERTDSLESDCRVASRANLMIIPKSNIFSSLIVLALLASPIFAEQPNSANQVQTVALETAAPQRSINVLILGDSLALCGFGKRLDEKFRADPRVKSVFTYMTCGTNPLSWLKEKPYAHVQTHCGFWSIESLPDMNRINELPDVYGMT